MFNNFTIAGRITHDLELRHTSQGKEVINFSVAVNRRFDHQKTDFVNVVAWHQTAVFVSKHFEKGTPIIVNGEMQSRQYTNKVGAEVTVWELIANQVSFTGSKNTHKKIDVGANAYKTGDTASFDDFDDNDLPF